MRRACLGLLALALLSCNSLPGSAPKGPSGPVGDVTRSVADLLSPNTTATDPRFDDFLELLDLKADYPDRAAAITAQIKAGRATVTKRAAAAAAGRLASVHGVLGESIVLEFATTLANSLDEFTKKSGTHDYPPLGPTTHTDEDAQTVTTSSRSQTQTLKSAGPQVTLTIVWNYKETTKDKATGATVAEIVEERTMTGAINVCPDDQGAVGAYIDVKGKFTGLTKSKTVTHGMTSSSVFTGYVDDSAALKRVHHVITDKQEWSGGGEDGHFDLTLAVDSAASESGSSTSGIDQGSATGALTGNERGIARASRLGGLSVALNQHSLDNAYQQAQRLWRNGRCVMVTAKDYSAETDIEVAKQSEPKHDETVDVSSETKFSVDLKHRFGGLLKAPITASLSGQKSLTPNRVDSAPSELTFKAPDEEGKKSTATLKSVSKRGIGTLVLDFHTGGAALTLSISGTFKLRRSFIGTLTETTNQVQIGPVEFKKAFGDMWEGTGEWRAQTSSFTSVPGATQTCTGTQSGQIKMVATLEESGGKKRWVIEPLDGSTTGTASTSCKGEINVEADAAESFLGTFKTFVIPEEGGSQAIHGNRGGFEAIGEVSSEGTLNAKTKK